MTIRFHHFVAIDWSGAQGARQKGIAIAVADADGGPPVLAELGCAWSRTDMLAILRDLPDDTLVGMDLGIALPFADCGAYFPGLPASPPDAKSLWALVDDVCRGDPHLSASSFVDHADFAPYFRRHSKSLVGREGTLFRCDDAPHGRGRFRVTEQAQAAMGCRPYSNFNLVGAAQVGKSSLTGMRVLHRLDGAVPVWPIDPLPQHGSAIVEIYTTIAAMAAGRSPGRAKMRSFEELDDALAKLGAPPSRGAGALEDHASDALLTAAWLRLKAFDADLWDPAALTPGIARTEGWTFGAV